MKKYFSVFLVIVLLQLIVVDETIAQRSRASNKADKKVTTLSNFEFSSWLDYQKFWIKQAQGFLVGLDGDAVYFLNQKYGVGIFGYIAGGGGQFDDGSYREPSFNWRAGAKGKLRTATSNYTLAIGYGQNLLNGEIASGLEDRIFSDFLFSRVEYQAFGRRVAGQTWLPEVKIYGEGKVARENERPPWSGKYIINYDLLPEIMKVGGEVTIVDIKLKDLVTAWGLTGAINMYDFTDTKIFYEVGTDFNFSYADNSVARVNLTYQNGVTGIEGINCLKITVGFDASFLFKINQEQTNLTNTNNKKRRTK
jgi:hypothetical protein